MEQHQVDQHSHYTGPRGEERGKRKKKFEEILVENVSNLWKKTDIQIFLAQAFQNKINTETHTKIL